MLWSILGALPAVLVVLLAGGRAGPVLVAVVQLLAVAVARWWSSGRAQGRSPAALLLFPYNPQHEYTEDT